MASVNLVEIIGYIAKIEETRVGDRALVKLSVPTTEKWKTATGMNEKTEWHRLVIWGKSAENAAKILRKGDLARFEGKLQTRSYEKGGQTLYATDIQVNDWRCLHKKAASTEMTLSEALDGPGPTNDYLDSDEFPT